MTKTKTGLQKPEPVPGQVHRYDSAGGAQIFRIPVQAFPRLWGNVYLAAIDDYRVLIDTGSGIGDSNQHLEAGLEAASRLSGMDLRLPNLTHILITHGHIDHYGGLNYIRRLSRAAVGIHELDQGAVSDHVERLSIVSRRLQTFLAEAGVPAEERGPILAMYGMIKVAYQSIPVDFTYEAMDMRLGPFQMLHVPGHCPGQVVIRLQDVLFSGDHVLDQITPHQAPESITPWTGLGHYLNSLEALRPWSREVRLTLGGHGEPITDLDLRLEAIRTVHMDRLKKVQEILSGPHTVAEVSTRLFGPVKGYDILLALEEAGAHIEYLYQRGLLSIANLDEQEQGREAGPVRYQSHADMGSN